MKVLRLQDILTAPNRLNAAAHRANWNAFKAHNRTRGWLKEQTVCQQWALAITVSFATSCPHSLWVSQLCPLALLISQTAEFGFQEKKKKKKNCSDFLQSSGTRRRGTNVNGWRKKWNMTKLHDPGREPRASAARWQSSQQQRDTDMDVITLCLSSLPEMKARVEDQSICLLKLD